MLHHWYQKRVDSIAIHDGLSLAQTTTLKQALRDVSSSDQTHSLIAIVDDENSFLGCLSLKSLIAAAVDCDPETHLKNLPWVADGTSLEISDSILKAMAHFAKCDFELLPICRGKTFVGFLSAQAIVANIMKFPLLDSSQLHNEINQFVSYVAHDLGNPLTIILLATGLLLQKPENKDSKNESALKMIQRATRQALRISDDLLQSERYVKLGRISTQTVDLGQLIAEIYCDNAEFVSFKGAKLVLEHCDKMEVALDPHLIKRALLNLIDNACKYSPKQGEIFLAARRSTHDLPAVEFSVRDQGKGFDPEEIDQIFEPFVQTGKPLMGYGLGLVIVRRFVELHGGKVWAENCLDGGAKFVLSIPLTQSSTLV